MVSDILQVEGINSKGFGTIPKLVMQDRRLTIQAKAIYAYFCSYAGAGKTAFPSRNKILYDLRISPTAYYKHFNLLKEYGYVMCYQERTNGSFTRNVYTLPCEVPTPCANSSCTRNYGTKSNSSKNNSIHNNQSVSQDGTDMDGYVELITSNIGYADLEITHTSDLALIDEMVTIILDVLLSTSPTVRVNGEDKPRELVKSMLLKLDYWDIDHVLSRYKAVTALIANKRAYLLSVLYNTKMERNAGLQNEFNRYNGGIT